MKNREDVRKDDAVISVYVDPEGKKTSLPRPKTAAQLLEKLNLGEGMAIVARDGELLTPDRRIWPNDEIYVRVVISRG